MLYVHTFRVQGSSGGYMGSKFDRTISALDNHASHNHALGLVKHLHLDRWVTDGNAVIESVTHESTQLIEWDFSNLRR